TRSAPPRAREFAYVMATRIALSLTPPGSYCVVRRYSLKKAKTGQQQLLPPQPYFERLMTSRSRAHRSVPSPVRAARPASVLDRARSRQRRTPSAAKAGRETENREAAHRTR